MDKTDRRITVNDYPPERIVHDIFSTCQTLREQGMAMVFESRDTCTNIDNKEGSLCCICHVEVYRDFDHRMSWLQGHYEEPLVHSEVLYKSDGFGIDELFALSDRLSALIKHDEVLL